MTVKPKTVSRELFESEDRYRQLVDLIPDAVVILQDGGYPFINQAFTRIFGYDEQDAAAGLSFFQLVHEQDMPAVRKRYEDRLAGKEVPRTFRLNLLTKDGRVVPCETSAALIRFQGRPADLVVMRDISERERTEQALEQRNAELASLHEAKDEFLAVASHEFRTPLVTGLGYLDLLLAGELGLESAQIPPELGIAHRSLRRLASLIDDLLSFQRLSRQSSDGTPCLQPVEVRLLFEECRADALALDDRSSQQIRIEAPADLPPVLADGEMIRRVLTNLVQNALRHGGSAIEIRLSAVVVADDRISLAVTDQGKGIPADFLTRAWEPFTRHDSRSEGSGLGLAIVQRILELHGTQATLYSEPNRGTSVGFTLPAAATTPPSIEKRDARRERPSLPASRLLVVDDDEETVEFLRQALSVGQLTVRTASSGTGALEVLGRESIDLVLADMAMPGMDGATLCRTIKQTPETASIPVLVFSARSEDEARTAALEAGCDAYLVKPMPLDELLRTIGNVLVEARR